MSYQGQPPTPTTSESQAVTEYDTRYSTEQHVVTTDTETKNTGEGESDKEGTMTTSEDVTHAPTPSKPKKEKEGRESVIVTPEDEKRLFESRWGLKYTKLSSKFYVTMIVTWTVVKFLAETAAYFATDGLFNQSLIDGLWPACAFAVIVYRACPRQEACRPVLESRWVVASMSWPVYGGFASMAMLLAVRYNVHVADDLLDGVDGRQIGLSFYVSMIGCGGIAAALIAWKPNLNGGYMAICTTGILTILFQSLILDKFMVAWQMGLFAGFLSATGTTVFFVFAPYPGFGFLIGSGVGLVLITVISALQNLGLVPAPFEVGDETGRDDLIVKLTIAYSLVRAFFDLIVYGLSLRFTMKLHRLFMSKNDAGQVDDEGKARFFLQMKYASSRYPSQLGTIVKQAKFVAGCMVVLRIMQPTAFFISYNTEYYQIDAILSLADSFVNMAVYSYLWYSDWTGWRTCQYWKLSRSFLNDHGIGRHHFDSDHHRCYCNRVDCYPISADCGVHYRGKPPKKFTTPVGWTRFGLKVDEHKSRDLGIFDWNVCFHGTTVTVLESILKHQQLLLPGDTLLSGKTLAIRENHITGQNYVYTSPTIKYAGQDYYASPQYWNGLHVRVALECRQFPDSVHVQPETIGWDQKHPGLSIDPAIDNSEVEWYTRRRVAVVLTGVLVKIEKLDGTLAPIHKDARDCEPAPEPLTDHQGVPRMRTTATSRTSRADTDTNPTSPSGALLELQELPPTQA